MIYYTKKEINDEINKILENNDDLYKIDDVENINENTKKEINYYINNNIYLMNNTLTFKLLNEIDDKIDFNDVFNNINLCYCPFLFKDNNNYHIDSYNSISYYEYNNLCFKDVNNLKNYIINYLKSSTNTLLNYVVDVDVDDIKTIFSFFDDDVENNIIEFEDIKTNEIYDLISTKKINISDEYYINVFVDDDINEIVDKLYDDLFNNFLNKEIIDLFNYKDFKLIFDDRLINYVNKNICLFEISDISEIKDVLLSEINYNYKDYLNKYYDLFNNFNLKYHIEIYKTDDYKNKTFNDDDDLINYLTSLY